MDDQRLDKWLWCARFYKTRALAVDAIKAGRVAVNDQIAKPSKALVVGDCLLVRLPPYEWVIEVCGLARQRLGAPEARKLYAETPASVAARERLREQLKLSAVVDDLRGGRLTKKDRRDREAFKRGTWADD
ncbi:MAG: RNA-binding S4 domain-containing protein [Gammaproteobacteria bacterium]|nr:RNA-binding S4 domain-containing protein [Gammaproteobacteria bacterium]